MKGINYLRDKLKTKKTRVNERYKFYEMKNRARDLGISTPPALQNLKSSLGWCAKSVDSIADRLQFREFRNDDFGINEIFLLNNPDIIFDSAILGALISSCDFIYIRQGEDGQPKLHVIDGSHATGIIDPVTGLLKEGYAVLETDEYDHPITEAYFIPYETQIYRRGEQNVEVFRHSVAYPLLVPIIYRPDAKRPFGHSRISRASMDLVSSALRTIKRSEIAAEFYSVPQKYINGLADDVEFDKWSAAMSAILTVYSDEEGNKPEIGQFEQQSMEPHTSQLKMFASMFAGENGLTLDDMGFQTGNPASAEAIKASHDQLRLTARKAQKTFGSGFLNTGYLATCLRDNKDYNRNEFCRVQPVWEPLFEPDSAMLASIGDGIIKLNQAVPGYVTNDTVRDLTGIKGGN